MGIGLFYQWGAIVGHTASDGYDFSEETYEAQGLNLITSDLEDSQDAARAFYGPAAKMPTSEQFLELFNYTSIQRDGNSFIITSNVNGNSLKFPAIGYMNGGALLGTGRLYCWSSEIENNSLRVYANLTYNVSNYLRYDGLNIMAVHS